MASLHLEQLHGAHPDRRDDLRSGRTDSVLALATSSGLRGDQASRIIQLAFLAADLTEWILLGDHPPEPTATWRLGLVPLPTDWEAQRVLLGSSGLQSPDGKKPARSGPFDVRTHFCGRG